jgi:2-polyprenyl-3-methyl-5-hydroxy-6-metoxy-1,4-benzoquinol methylase
MQPTSLAVTSTAPGAAAAAAPAAPALTLAADTRSDSQEKSMKKHMFTSDEIDTHKSDRKEWHSFVRRREAEIAFSLFPDLRFRHALELGAGDGGQSLTIAKHCDRLTCTEKDERSHAWLGQTILQRQAPDIEYMICDAQDLSRFSDRTFDLVFSSNMLEHIPDVDRCLGECRRVLTDDGLMLHLMPSRWWKLFNLGLSVLKLRPQGTHGVSTNLWREFYVFGATVWTRRIESNGLRVQETIGMPFYVGHGNTFVQIIKAGNALGLPASFLYVIRKD